MKNGPRRQVSTDGGTEPLWSRDGSELFFQSGSRPADAALGRRVQSLRDPF
jgi:hypothetical protein